MPPDKSTTYPALTLEVSLENCFDDGRSLLLLRTIVPILYSDCIKTSEKMQQHHTTWDLTKFFSKIFHIAALTSKSNLTVKIDKVFHIKDRHRYVEIQDIDSISESRGFLWQPKPCLCTVQNTKLLHLSPMDAESLVEERERKGDSWGCTRAKLHAQLRHGAWTIKGRPHNNFTRIKII